MNRYYVPVELAWTRGAEHFSNRFEISFLA